MERSTEYSEFLYVLFFLKKNDDIYSFVGSGLVYRGHGTGMEVWAPENAEGGSPLLCEFQRSKPGPQTWQ